MVQKTFSLISALLLAMALTACGGGGGGGGSDDGDGGGGSTTSYSGSTSEATVDDQNTEDVSRASAEGTRAAILQTEAEEVAPLGTSGTLSTQSLAEIQLDLIRREAPKGYQVSPQATSTVSGDCGGSATITTNTNSAGTVTTGSVVYSSFCVSTGSSGDAVFNGTVEFTMETDSGGQLVSYEFSYNNFTATAGGETQTLNATVSCTFTSTTWSCSTQSDFEGSDGRVYRTTDIQVSGDSASGYDVNARVYDPDHGYVDIVATNITTNCANGNIGTGTITVTDSTGTDVMTVTFNSCTSYTVTYNGVSNTYNW